MKKFRVIGLNFVLSLMILLVASATGVTTAFTSSDNNFEVSDFSIADGRRISREIFGNTEIKSIEYIYGFNDSPDYIYIDFADYGYAVYFRETMEMMEYSPIGSLPYDNTGSRKYYAGPSNYFEKKGERFVNTLTGFTLHLSQSDASSYSRQLSEVFSLNKLARQDYLLEVEKSVNVDVEVLRHTSGNKKPDIDTLALITADPPGVAGATYIPNAQYFTPTNPTHGFNEHGTCGSVVAQLMLSYNNFYNDRRIIAPEHMNGGWNNSTGNNNIHDPANYLTRAYNPNVSVDPTSTTRQTTGTNNDFYNHVISSIEAGALNCVCTETIVDTVVANGTATITTTVIVRRPNGTSTTTTDTTTRLALPGETSSWDSNTTHTHNGSSTTAVRNGLRDILGQRIATNQYTVNSDEKGWFFGWSPISSIPIKNEINAGRPVIIGMSSNLGGSNHWVLGYGYQTYTYPIGHSNEGETYSGYIVHFGWTNRVRIWINESWCNKYISMQLHHTHNYNIDTGINHNGTHREVRCVCGHRTTESLFNVSGSTVTGARFPLTDSIKIPPIINGTTITTIGNSAFINQNQFSHIDIPSSITSIGSSAFKNCTGLTNITLPNNLTSIGAYAFEGCNNFNEIHIPSSVTQISKDAFYNTNNIPIYINDRIIIPSTFDVNWNSSGNPVYLNGSICTHNSGTTLIKLNDALHGYLCNKCRTVNAKTGHTSSAPYIPIYGMNKHYASCTCGTIMVSCIGFAPPGEQAYCYYCGQPTNNVLNRVYDDIDDLINYFEEYYCSCCNH